MVDVAYFLLSKFPFRDEKNNLLILESPQFSRFLQTLLKRTGGETDFIGAASTDIGVLQGQVSSLLTRMSAAESSITTLQSQVTTLLYKVAVLELDAALKEEYGE